MALEHVGYSGLREEQAHSREHGGYTGIGVSTYCEICGLGPSQVAGAVGFGGGLWESAVVRFHPSGKVNAYVGVSPHGQGEETTFAQVVSDTLGVPVEDVEIVHGDTDNTPMGWGTYGSRTTAVGAGALVLGLNKIKEKARALAAHLLEAAEADIEYADGQFFVRGAPDQSKSIQEIALMANVAWNMPEGMEPGLEASAFYDPPNFVYPFGAHVAVVDVDADNGHVVLRRYVAVDDCGPQINPMIVEGQVHGGVVQGAGQALWEGAVYGDDGQLLTGTMQDYALPKAHMVPDIETLSSENAVAPQPSGRQGHRRNRHHRLHGHHLQRGHRRIAPAGRHPAGDATDSRSGCGRPSRTPSRSRVAPSQKIPSPLRGREIWIQELSDVSSPV